LGEPGRQRLPQPAPQLLERVPGQVLLVEAAVGVRPPLLGQATSDLGGVGRLHARVVARLARRAGWLPAGRLTPPHTIGRTEDGRSGCRTSYPASRAWSPSRPRSPSLTR